MEIIHGNEAEFAHLITDGMVLVDFYATWCGPCKMLGPVLEELATKHDDVKIVKMDIDQNPELAKSYGIMSVPTMLLFKDRAVIDKKVGFMPKELIDNWIKENQ